MSKPDYSPQRRATVISLLRDHRKDAEWWQLTENAKETFTLGAIICDQTGKFTKTDLDMAANDARAISYARRLMREAGV